MSTLATILNTLVVILAVLLIALILVQPSKSGGGSSDTRADYSCVDLGVFHRALFPEDAL